MKKIWQSTSLSIIIIGGSIIGLPVATAEQTLFIAYPPDGHQTTAEKIFLIGTASPEGKVTINGQPIEQSQGGHFAPSFPLHLGDNQFTIRHKNQEIQLQITRIRTFPQIPDQLAFAKDSLTPERDLTRLPGELICFSAIAPPQGTVSVQLGTKTIPLLPQLSTVQLPSNFAVYTNSNQPTVSNIGKYEGCTSFLKIGKLGIPLFQLSLDGKTITQRGSGTVEIISPNQLEVIEVISTAGVARTGPSTDYSRLTPLPKGTRAAVTGKEGEWLRLDYGAWIQQKETKLVPSSIPPKSLIRSITYRPIEGATEIIFPLQIPVPLAVKQRDDKFTLTLYNVTAQTDTIWLDDNPIIKRLDWQQVTPQQIQYTFHLKSQQQWGYELRYEGTKLILSLRHPPKLEVKYGHKLEGITILLDPGHGGKETGSRGPNGYPEKDVNLAISKKLRDELIRQGATVYLTRERDEDVSLQERVDRINKLKPTLALSIHYNALPDNGDAINTKGISTFWYHPQSHDLSLFLHNYLVEKLQRTSHGVYWNNLALTRPHAAPSVLLELGFMINPEESEWIINPQEQEKLAKTLADGISEWFHKQIP